MHLTRWLAVEVLVERVLLGAGWVVGNDGERVLVCDRLAKQVAVVGGVGHDDLSRQPLDQGLSLGRIAPLAAGQDEPHRTAQAPHSQVDFGAQPAARAAKGLIFRPRFWPPPRVGGCE